MQPAQLAQLFARLQVTSARVSVATEGDGVVTCTLGDRDGLIYMLH